jgi:hypothetical protein
MALLADFTVDDALIPARYALSLARGEGYRPSPGSPPSDGVTPLGFAHLLTPFATGGVQAAHRAARMLGALSGAVTGGALALAIAMLGGSRWRWAAMAIVATSAPLAGWAMAGLETGLVTAMVAVALLLRERGRSRMGAAVLGLAAGWRPELAPLAIVVAAAGGPDLGAAPPEVGGSGREWKSARARVVRVGLALAPLALLSTARVIAFGRAAPLSIHAKLPDTSSGLAYAGAASLLAGLVAVLAPLGLRRADAWTRWLAAAVVTHVVAMVVAGGDWMPLARLAVPAIPVAVLVSARLLATGGRLPSGIPALVVALGFQVFGAIRAWPAVREVGAGRARLIEEMRPVLASSRRIACVDVGWVGAAAEHAHLVDLAGVTDPTIAALPSGHTSRRIPASLLDDREVDALVLLLARGEARAAQVPWTDLRFARGTEAWLATQPGIGDDFELRFVSATSLRYVVVQRRAP